MIDYLLFPSIFHHCCWGSNTEPQMFGDPPSKAVTMCNYLAIACSTANLDGSSCVGPHVISWDGSLNQEAAVGYPWLPSKWSLCNTWHSQHGKPSPTWHETRHYPNPRCFPVCLRVKWHMWINLKEIMWVETARPLEYLGVGGADVRRGKISDFWTDWIKHDRMHATDYWTFPTSY